MIATRGSATATVAQTAWTPKPQIVRREAARFDHVRNVENRALFVFGPLQVRDRIVTLKGCLQTG